MSESINRPVVRCALYLRVSTGEQTTANQSQSLSQVAAQRGWQIVASYADAGISGAKTREQRPGLDSMLTAASRGEFDVLMSWSVDRLGRSLRDLLNTLEELRGANVDLFLHQQGLDTRTPTGRAMFGMLGIFSEFEREMIRARVNAGLDRRRREGKSLGRPKVGRERDPETRKARKDQRDDAIRMLREGESMNHVMRKTGLGSSAVQRMNRELKTAPTN